MAEEGRCHPPHPIHRGPVRRWGTGASLLGLEAEGGRLLIRGCGGWRETTGLRPHEALIDSGSLINRESSQISKLLQIQEES